MADTQIFSTPSQIRAWAGEAVFKRGQSYQHSGRVHELAATQDGTLVAWVEGSRRYATRVNLGTEQPTADCTCPYGSACKHAVAVALQYVNRLERTPLPTAPPTDPRIILLDRAAVHTDDPFADAAAQEKAVRDFLASYSQAELVELVVNLTQRFSGVYDAIAVRRMLASNDAAQLEAEVLARIHGATAETDWNDQWDDDEFVPDYDPIRDTLRLLLDQGHADTVVRLGEHLLEDGIEQVEHSHDEGEIALDIASCLAIVFEALPASSLQPDEQIMWAMDAMLRDDYDLCDGAQDVLDEPYATATWSTVADTLLRRLDTLPVAVNEFSREYQREKVVNFALLALEQSERTDEIVPLCVRETRGNRGYERLVKQLLALGRRTEAEQWARTGIEATAHQYPGIAGALIKIVCTLRGEAGDWAMVAAFRAEQFFQHPATMNLRVLEEAAARAGQAPAVRAAAMYYLETGQLPQRKPRPVDGATIPAWPLPDTGIAPTMWRYPTPYPQLGLLIALAIEEQQPGEVLRWYDRRDSLPFLRLDDDAIATAVARTFPDRAATIWQALIESRIAQTNTASYEEAANFLRKLRVVWRDQGNVDQWYTYVENLRTTNKRKRRLTEILDALLGLQA